MAAELPHDQPGFLGVIPDGHGVPTGLQCLDGFAVEGQRRLAGGADCRVERSDHLRCRRRRARRGVLPPLDVLLPEPPLAEDDALAFDAPEAVAAAEVVNVKALEPPMFAS